MPSSAEAYIVIALASTLTLLGLVMVGKSEKRKDLAELFIPMGLLFTFAGGFFLGSGLMSLDMMP